MNQQLQNLSGSNALKVYQACNFFESATKSLWVDSQLGSPNSQLDVDQQKLWESVLTRTLDKTITSKARVSDILKSNLFSKHFLVWRCSKWPLRGQCI